jgi:single-strand DNA-binding protein
MSINKVILVGNVGKDPVIRYFDKGVAKVTFPLATSETYTNQQGETITSTEWHNIVLWRALAEVAEKTVKKGAQVYIVGKIKTRSYVDKDGNNKYITEILADTLLLLEKKQGPVSTANTNGSFSDIQGGEKKKPVNDKESTGSEINEPGSAYHLNDGSDDKGLQNKGSFSSNENMTGGGSFDEGTGTGKNEDDLPF